jgi:hypothetical protein
MPIKGFPERACEFVFDEAEEASGNTPSDGTPSSQLFENDEQTDQPVETLELPAAETVATENESATVPAQAPAIMPADAATDVVPIVVNPRNDAIVRVVERLNENGFFLHAGAVPQMENVNFTSNKKDRSTAELHWKNDALDITNRQIALFVQVVDPTDAPSKVQLPWRLSNKNPLLKLSLSPHTTTYGYVDTFSAKYMVIKAPPSFDPNLYYSLDATVSFLQKCDELVFAHGGKLCTGLIAQFKALHDKNATDTIEKYIAVSRAGDKLLHVGTSSPTHTRRS